MIEFDQWRSLLRDLRRAPSMAVALQMLFMPPGWTAGAEGQTTEDLRRRARLVDTPELPTRASIQQEGGTERPIKDSERLKSGAV